MTLTYQDNFGRTIIVVEHNEEHNYIQASFLGVQLPEVLKQAGANVLKLIAEKKCYKYLSDNTKLVGGKEVSANWITDNFIPKATAAGIRNLAYVFPPQASNIRLLTALDLNLPPQLNLMLFDNAEDARHWLIEQ